VYVWHVCMYYLLHFVYSVYCNVYAAIICMCEFGKIRVCVILILCMCALNNIVAINNVITLFNNMYVCIVLITAVAMCVLYYVRM
jgi:hypothetical protein